MSLASLSGESTPCVRTGRTATTDDCEGVDRLGGAVAEPSRSGTACLDLGDGVLVRGAAATGAAEARRLALRDLDFILVGDNVLETCLDWEIRVGSELYTLF